MCEGSIHVKHRNMKESEDLRIDIIPGHGMAGYYPADASAKDQQLVCVRGTVDAVIDVFKFNPRFCHASHLDRSWQALDGKANLKVRLRHQGYSDEVLVGTIAIPLIFLVGCTVRVPPTKVGVAAVNAAIDEATKVPTVLGRALSMTKEAIRSRARRAAAKANA